MNDVAVVVEQIDDEHTPSSSNEEMEDMREKQSTAEEFTGNCIHRKRHKPMNPTPLYIFFFLSFSID